MQKIYIRILHRSTNGEIKDFQDEYELSDFAGMVPAVGDTIVNPLVLEGADRTSLENRTIWTVVGRVFYPKDNKDSVALIVSERGATEQDRAFA